jgi:hypothetical protein
MAMKKESLPFQRLTRLVKDVLRSSKDIESAAPSLLEVLAKWFDCQWAAYWMVNSDLRVLRAIATWTENPLPLKRLVRDTETRALSLSEGTAGQVWRSGQPFCTSDLIRDMCLPRSLDAEAAGLCGGIWFPIRAKQTTHGVIELLGRHSWTDDQPFLDQLMTLGELIGERLPDGRKPESL